MELRSKPIALVLQTGHSYGVWSLAIFFTPKGLRRSAQGCCTRLPLEQPIDDAQPQRSYGSVPHITHPILRCARAAVPELILPTGKVATLSGLVQLFQGWNIRRGSQGS